MFEQDSSAEQAIRERAYYLWVNEGRPEGRDYDHWMRARAGFQARRRRDDAVEDEEKILAGRHDVNLPALLTRDVPGG